MSLDRQQVCQDRLFGAISLDDAELTEMTSQLGKIVDGDQLSEVDTEGIEPLFHAIELQNVLQEDSSKHRCRQQALANAPDADEECFFEFQPC